MGDDFRGFRFPASPQLFVVPQGHLVAVVNSWFSDQLVMYGAFEAPSLENRSRWLHPLDNGYVYMYPPININHHKFGGIK